MADASVRRMRRSWPLSRIAWVLALSFVLVGFVVLLGIDISGSGQEAGFVVTRSIGAYERINAQDLAPARVTQEHGETVTDRRDIEGRYALKPIVVDAPVTRDSIGAIAPPGLAASALLTVTGGPAVSLNGQLAAGDSVDVLLPAVGNLPADPIRGAFVLDSRPTGQSTWAITLALPMALDPIQRSQLADGRVVLLRV